MLRRLAFSTLSCALVSLLVVSVAAQDQLLPAGMQMQSTIFRVAYLQESDAAVDDWVEKSSGMWTTRWGGRYMGDFQFHGGQSAAYGTRPENAYETRRLRFFSEGKAGFGGVGYRVQLDFSDADSVIKDVYLGLDRLGPMQQVRIGHFKAPFSLEELTSSRYITFMERGLPNMFAPSREFGIEGGKLSEDQMRTVRYGFFTDNINETNKESNGATDPATGTDLGSTFAIRYTSLAQYESDQNFLHVGLAYRHTNRDQGTVRFRSRPEVHIGPRLFDSSSLAAGSFDVLGVEMALVNGPWLFQSEYMNTQAEGTEFHGAYLFGSYFLTGESRPYKKKYGVFDRVIPNRNWGYDAETGAVGGPGAWQLTVRWSSVEGTGQRLDNFTLGTNWYLNPYTRLMLNYVNTRDIDNLTADILAMRVQFDF